MGKRKTYEIGVCPRCEQRRMLVWFRKQWICEKCMLGPMPPLRLESFIHRSGMLGDVNSAQGGGFRKRVR